MKKVSITIPCRNEERYIEKCLDSVVNSTYPKEFLQVFVVDGMSTDSTKELVNSYCGRFPFIHLIENKKKITPVARNLGVHAAAADIYFIVDAHASIYPDFIQNAVDAFNIHESIGCTGGVIEQVNENATSEIIAAAMSSPFGVGNAHFRTGTKEGYVDTLAFGAYKKEVFEKVGYFDEELVRNQDDEFNFRVIKGGFKIYLSQKIRSKYYVRASYSKLYRQYFQYGYWKVFVNQKHGAVTSGRQLIPPLFVAGFILGVAGSLISPEINLLWGAAMCLYILSACLFAARMVGFNISKIIKVAATFFILHFSYGSGYLKGVLNFLILKKKPEKKHESLSR
jgi:glycosyltransferase involved in cell wall biosynthesis